MLNRQNAHLLQETPLFPQSQALNFKYLVLPVIYLHINPLHFFVNLTTIC